MKRFERLTSRTGLTMLVATALSVGLAGCAAFSPAVITTPYPASDGTATTIPGTDVALRNFLVVAAPEGEAGAVIGTIVNDGDDQVRVSLTIHEGPDESTPETFVTVQPHAAVRIGPDADVTMRVTQLAGPAGAMTTMSAKIDSAGTSTWDVPIVLAAGPYASLTPAPTPTPTPSAAASPSSTKTSKPTESPTP